ncbi:hexameric tyrosine-coordinated heme protein [Aquimarina algiphila]|uniref:hexameric tyrosine-coordinated heme protein n=1 Tax=Aquimarina algiphila TaxID=2047982 RepID=UPI0024922375|nr:hexameric tyrosine-coordinated heme protein [Aquimarina algiphila]
MKPNNLDMEQKEIWLKSLITESPQEGYELAIQLSRMGVKSIQPDIEVLKRLRTDYANSASGLTAASHVIALNFQTISAANGYWR